MKRRQERLKNIILKEAEDNRKKKAEKEKEIEELKAKALEEEDKPK